MAARSPLPALVGSQPTSRYFSQVDAQQQLTHLLLIAPSAKEMCSKYSAGSVWLLDTTYKTNKFGLPLLHIIGVTSSNTTFTFAYCFMRYETVMEYLWAMDHIKQVFQEYDIRGTLTFITDRELALMNALEQTFPDAYCLLRHWHISKGISAKQRKAFETRNAWEDFVQAWNGLVAATTMVEYETKLAAMHVAFPVVSMHYLEETWLVYKEKFVAAFLRNKRHYGHVTTWRVGSAHNALKKCISSSPGDILSVESAVRLACEGQLAVMVQQNAKQRAIVNMHFGPIFSEVMGKISVAGLSAAYQQYQLRLGEDENCQGLFKSTMGYPCAHAFRHRVMLLSVNDFDQHWWLAQPRQMHVEAAPVGIEMALKRIADEYDNAPNHRKRVLLDYVLAAPVAVSRKRVLLDQVVAVPEAGSRMRMLLDDVVAAPEVGSRKPMQVQTRGRPTGSTQRLLSQSEHVAAALEAPVRLRQCRICKQTGHNARTCRRQAPAPAPAVDLEAVD